MERTIELFFSGGIFMYPLTLLSITTIAVLLERIISEIPWRRRILTYIGSFKRGEAIQDKHHNHWNVDEHYYTMSLESQEKILNENIQAMFDRRLIINEIISTIGNSAPLLGFIGTVSGMVNSFTSIANADRVSIKLVASGISEALITTGYGLIIAVICILSESIFRYRTIKFSHLIEEEVNQYISNKKLNIPS